MSQTEDYPKSDLATSQSGEALDLRSPDTPAKQQTTSSSPRRPDIPHHQTPSGSVRPRLLPFILPTPMAFSAVFAGPASASPTPGKHESSEHSAGRPQPDRALARLVLSPAGASTRAGSSQTHTAKGRDAAGPVEPPRRPVEPPRRPVEPTSGSVEPSRRPVNSTTS